MKHTISCIVGLGNPGEKYRQTRHNAGFWYIDQLAARHGCSLRNETRFQGDLGKLIHNGNPCWLLKPSVFMNRSGQSVRAICQYYRLSAEQILVVHDDLDLPPGTLRFKQGGGHGGHNGLRNIIDVLGSRDFHRLRIGIGHPGHRDQVVDYVLNRPGKEERASILESIDMACRHTDQLIDGKFQQLMNTLHRL